MPATLGLLAGRGSSELFTQRRAYLMVKRVMDILTCMLALLALLPLFGLIALMIKLDTPGPVLFTQLRTGRDGARFQMLKFRTMVQGAEELKASLRHLSVVPWPDFKVINDPRVTRVGRILRRTSLDELPQVINVLRGEMTLVGPRPTSFDASAYELWHTRRLDASPGMTGLWQVKGRHTTTFDERLRLDSRYIARRSFLFDLLILLGTVRAVFQRSGA
ncbi:MAG: sugar transferase [Egibacteraceae bacterium]